MMRLDRCLKYILFLFRIHTTLLLKDKLPLVKNRILSVKFVSLPLRTKLPEAALRRCSSK